MNKKITNPMHIEWPIFKWFRLILEVGVGWSLFVLYLVVVRKQEFETFAQSAIPILAIYLTTAGLFYNRARALPSGKAQIRSLYAAERSTQATIFSLIGVLVGVAVYGVSSWFGLRLEAAENLKNSLIFVAYFIPLAFIIFGYISFLLSLRAASKDFLRPLTAREICGRIKDAPRATTTSQ